VDAILPLVPVMGTYNRGHRELILNWFQAKGKISNGVVEGMNNKAKLIIRKSYGFRSPETLEMA